MSQRTKYNFSTRSKRKLETVDKRLQLVANRVIDIVDFTVLEGVRGKDRQNRLFKEGKSKLEWPESKHNVIDPASNAKAFDLAPYPIDWNNSRRFYYLAGIVKAVAHEMGIKIRWGGDWDSDNDFSDQDFNDLVHFELLTEKTKDNE